MRKLVSFKKKNKVNNCGLKFQMSKKPQFFPLYNHPLRYGFLVWALQKFQSDIEIDLISNDFPSSRVTSGFVSYRFQPCNIFSDNKTCSDAKSLEIIFLMFHSVINEDFSNYRVINLEVFFFFSK